MSGADLTVPQVAARMAEVLRTRGWHQGWYYERNADLATCPVCVLGALHAVLGGSPDADIPKATMPMFDSVYAAIADGGGIKDGVSRWNDRQRSVVPVLAVLDAIADTEPKEQG